ncbi:hypothetical protein HN588_13240 [Candidatus Bathyarchaeota archaeon]|jgi:hypothetical protein|nr:hypothetical protein [Candidatus Bathyarchaeota archaeon]
MNIDELIVQEVELQRQAHEVLDALNLLHFLSKYGRPKIVGSVALGLMTWRDIDIDLEITGEIREEDFWQTAKYLLAQDEITLVTLVDNREIIEKNRPPSMYIGGTRRPLQSKSGGSSDEGAWYPGQGKTGV